MHYALSRYCATLEEPKGSRISRVAWPSNEGLRAMVDRQDQASGMRLDGGKNSGFWQINIGHIFTMIVFLCGLVSQGAGLVQHYTTLENQGQATQSQVIALQSDLTEMKNELGDLRGWRERQEAESRDWKTSIETSFDDIKRHLERLDWLVGDRPGAPPPYVSLRRH